MREGLNSFERLEQSDWNHWTAKNSIHLLSAQKICPAIKCFFSSFFSKCDATSQKEYDEFEVFIRNHEQEKYEIWIDGLSSGNKKKRNHKQKETEMNERKKVTVWWAPWK